MKQKLRKIFRIWVLGSNHSFSKDFDSLRDAQRYGRSFGDLTAYHLEVIFQNFRRETIKKSWVRFQ